MEVHSHPLNRRWALRQETTEELLDLGEGSLQEVSQNLEEMQRINDLLGGTRALTRHLYPRLLLHNEQVWLLDLGTGGAGLPVALVRWARRLRLPLRVLAVDWSARNLAVSASGLRHYPEVQLLRADALSLPVQPLQVDYIVSTLFLHHLLPEQVVHLLKQCYTLASKGIIMSDLVRGWLPLVGFHLIKPVFARSRLTWYDGALSVRRAYTPRELLSLAVRAGLHGAQVHTHWPWRMTLVVEK